MNFQDRFIRGQIELLKPISGGSKLEVARNLQDKMGKIMRFTKRYGSVVVNKDNGRFRANTLIPRDELRGGVILYLHGGGYTCGKIDYANGFASVLSSECGMRVYTIEYSLAPENPYPAALDDAVFAYNELLSEGYPPEKIILAGESAGAGLAYALCLKLRELSIPTPAGIIAISPWVDLTHTAESIAENKDIDPCLTKERLDFFANCYVGAISDREKAKKMRGKRPTPTTAQHEELKRDPLVSPIFADLTGMPPSIIFVGSDEILLSDAVALEAALTAKGCRATLHVREGMWHAYLLYGLKSSLQDFNLINSFLKHTLPRDNERKLRWMRLDNSAKIYPAAATRHWSNLFRLSATLSDECEDIDVNVLQSALDVTVRRFPSISVRLRTGIFWYYLEEIPHAPRVRDERGCPLVHMPFDDIRSCAFRVLVYKKRIAVEFFHALTDGNGGLVFLKTLVAEYLAQKYSIDIPAENGVLDRLEPPPEEELEDCFPKHIAPVGKSRSDNDSYRIMGTRLNDGFRFDTTLEMSADELHKKARELGVTVTAYLTAVFIQAGISLQREDVSSLKKQKAVKVLVPVDLRRLFDERTLRNFVLYVTPGVDPRLGEYTFPEVCKIVQAIMNLEITPKNMAARIQPNVRDEKNIFLKLAPLFLKNIVMKSVFRAVGERKSSLSLSNLGVVKLPEVMMPYVKEIDFILSVQSNAPYNAGVVSFKGKTRLHITRNIIEPRLEMSLYRVLRELGIHVLCESNNSSRILPKTNKRSSRS